ncbi:MAG: hypothetical protein O2960_29540, partial [Verrucomicrobia bacterium]|nr:hypothetical protein [Verrucomicrobiota bacterium]
IWGLSLLDWAHVVPPLGGMNSDYPGGTSTSDDRLIPPEDVSTCIPSAFYALLRLCFRRPSQQDGEIPIVPAILLRAMNGDGEAASERATRRLRGSGKAPLVASLPVRGDIARRTAAAMLFPICTYDMSDKGPLQKYILKNPNNQTK